MNLFERGKRFAFFVGQELKGQIKARGFTAGEVARNTKHSESGYARWLNGKVEIPVSVVYETCDYIGIEPRLVIELAYIRLARELELMPVPVSEVADTLNTDKQAALQEAATHGYRRADYDSVAKIDHPDQDLEEWQYDT